AAQPNGPQTGDALLKLGHCLTRLAALQAQPPERAKTLQAARGVYDKLLSKQFNGHPAQPQALVERAKCFAKLNDPGSALRDLRAFTNDPLRNTPVAPVALVELATLLRGQNNAKEAVGVLAKAREQYEQALLKDPQRVGWAALL